MHYKHLSVEEREIIQRGLWEKKSIRNIAQSLGRSAPTVSREIQRNLDSLGRRMYIPRVANQKALLKRKSRGRQNRLKNQAIRDYVVSHLTLRWSPEQIANRIKQDISEASISHEAIYQYIYHQIHREGYGYLKPGCQDLRMYLRRRKKRRTHQGCRRCQRVLKPRGTSINLRPQIINQRARLGDWEGDTIESVNHKPGINTLVERKTGIVFISKLKDRTSQATAKVVSHRLSSLPAPARQSLTTDNGSENQDWPSLEKTGLRCFYANAYHSWERGTNENTNGLIRDFFPRKTDFTIISQEEIQEVECLLNTRPRKRLNWLTPLESFSKELSNLNISLNIPSVALAG